MKRITLFSAVSFLLFSVMLSSCAAIEGIFKAGMGVGIFIVLAVIGIIVAIIIRAGRNKSK